MLIDDYSIPRGEYPRPQMVRDRWINLNGPWEFEMDHSKSGRARKLQEILHFSSQIIVPFCPESKLSGIEYKDFMAAVWYKREIIVPETWQDGRILLHFGAIDYNSEVWVNGTSVGTHRGGYTSFLFDITTMIRKGSNTITVCAEDDVRSGLQPAGKQSVKYHSYECSYTRTTGIWQTVWLEYVPWDYISSFKLIPDAENRCIHIEAKCIVSQKGYTFQAAASFDGKAMGISKAVMLGDKVRITLPLLDVYLWEPGIPNLYDLELSLYKDEACIDLVKSYIGLRTISLDKYAFRINGKSIFQRLVLDQGYYPDGIYTAPSDEALKKDIEISIGLGFNGARLHEKIFEPRYLYWADKLGYLVWGEHANWGLDVTTAKGLERFLPEWLECLERDFNHPSIIGWCPFNETWDLPETGTRVNEEVLKIVYKVTKMVDTTRPVIDSSGAYHFITDIYDVHDYEQDVDKFIKHHEPSKTDGEFFDLQDHRQTYGGQPYFISEYGGIGWNPDNKDGWGYGMQPTNEEEFISRYKGLTETLLNHPKMFGFCYTQLYDVEQEINGLYTYERRAKFNPEIIKSINNQKAAIED